MIKPERLFANLALSSIFTLGLLVVMVVLDIFDVPRVISFYWWVGTMFCIWVLAPIMDWVYRP